MKGLIFDIKRFAIHDGPGIRTTVFFKGCPLACRWCHNPESQAGIPETILRKDRVGDHEFEFEELLGTYYSCEELMNILKEDQIFYNTSGGGITFSGGEPLQQIDFLIQILKECKRAGLHTAIDTSGQASRHAFAKVMPYTDLFLYDIKHLDPVKHKTYTGATNSLILKNFEFLLDAGAKIMIRMPVVPGFNDDDIHLDQMRAFMERNQCPNLQGLRLLPYHKSKAKYNRCDKLEVYYEFEPPSLTRIKELESFFKAAELSNA